MINLQDVNLRSAEQAYLVANTPSFIMRALRGNPLVTSIAKQHSSQEILETLLPMLAVVPDSSHERVAPFILMQALASRQDRKALLSLGNEDLSNYRWLQPFYESLVATLRPTTNGQMTPVTLTGEIAFATTSARNTQSALEAI